MAVGYIWYWPVRPWVNNADHTWTWSMDVSIPAHTAYAFAATQYLSDPVAFAGISDYATAPGGVHAVGNNQRNNVVPAIWDSNVTSVGFSWGLGPSWRSTGRVEADFTFQIFGWE